MNQFFMWAEGLLRLSLNVNKESFFAKYLLYGRPLHKRRTS